MITPDDKDLFLKIARDYLSIVTLESRNRDSLDFYSVAVWQVESALEAAYEAGFKDALAREHQTKEVINSINKK